jgi:3-isopropylmalate/(R)-2-methylmalate dehydratase small subunit
MQPFRTHRGLAAPLDRVNVDTDQIIPKQFLKRIERTGFGEFLFHDWRRDPEFVLNLPRYRGASVLVGDRNFGCGSSREHAVWALADYGFRAVLAPSFSDIFANNCSKNGFLAVQLTESEIAVLLDRSANMPNYELVADLENCAVTDDLGFQAKFQMDAFARHCLLNGLDDIGLTLQHETEIEGYELKHAVPVAFGRG